MSATPLSEAMADASQTADGAEATHERARITKNGHDYLVLLPDEDVAGFESIEATLELLNDPEAQQRIESAEQDIARGDVLAEEIVRALIARQTRQTPG
jgi:PHD/YefM family antitoxin component YafN of YafNO toxin-antitoxin module